MSKANLVSALLIAASISIGFGCSGDPSGTNANAVNNAPANVNSVPANANSAPADANNVAEKRGYPPEVTEEFFKSCEESGGERDFCVCVFDKVQQEYTYEEFSVIESKIVDGEPPDDFVAFTDRARSACTKEPSK